MNKRSIMKMMAIGWIFLFGSNLVAAQEAAPLSLEEAQSLAKKNSPTLQIAREKLSQAHTIIGKAWSMVKPQINLVESYTHNNEQYGLLFPDFNSISLDPTVCGGQPFCFSRYDNMQIQKQNTFSTIATLNQPIFLARAISTIGNAYNAYDLAKINTENAEEFLLFSLSTVYYGALTAQKFLSIAKQSVETRQEHLKVAKAKFEVGDTPKINVLRSEIDLTRAEQDAKRAENALALTKEAIRLLIGRDQDFSLIPPEPAKPPSQTMEVFIDQALAQRRDLQSAKLNLKIAETQKDDAWYRFLPNLVLTGMFRYSDVKGFSDKYYSWNIGLALSISLYDGGLRYAYLDEARSKIREATIQITDKERSIRSEIRQLWLKMEMAEANLQKASRAVALAKEQSSLAKVSFEAGAATNLEVVDANTMLFAAEISQAQEEFNLQLAIMRLEKAVKMFDPTGGSSGGMGSGGMGGGDSSSMGGGGEATGGSSEASSMSGAPAGMSSLGGGMGR